MVYKSLVASIIKCLKQLLECDDLSADSRESLEVSIQCLESAYGVHASDAEANFDILQLFKNVQSNTEKKATPDAAAKAEAENLKLEGNALMKNEKYTEALAKYSKAISIDATNPVFFSNRATANLKLGNFQQVIKDCRTALSLDPNYSKAYDKLGSAYSSLNRHQEARENFKKALDLDPNNETFKIHLQLTEEKLTYPDEPLGRGAGAAFPNMDISSLLSNPSLMTMARQMLSDPTMQNMMSTIMTENVERGGGMEAVLEAGLQLARQMQQANPDLIESISRQFDPNPSEPEAEEKREVQ